MFVWGWWRVGGVACQLWAAALLMYDGDTVGWWSGGRIDCLDLEVCGIAVVVCSRSGCCVLCDKEKPVNVKWCDRWRKGCLDARSPNFPLSDTDCQILIALPPLQAPLPRNMPAGRGALRQFFAASAPQWGYSMSMALNAVSLGAMRGQGWQASAGQGTKKALGHSCRTRGALSRLRWRNFSLLQRAGPMLHPDDPDFWKRYTIPGRLKRVWGLLQNIRINSTCSAAVSRCIPSEVFRWYSVHASILPSKERVFEDIPTARWSSRYRLCVYITQQNTLGSSSRKAQQDHDPLTSSLLLPALPLPLSLING